MHEVLMAFDYFEVRKVSLNVGEVVDTREWVVRTIGVRRKESIHPQISS